MLRLGIFYGSSTGHTRDVAEAIASRLKGSADVNLHDVGICSADAMQDYDFLILGTSTWGEGALQDDWETYLEYLDAVDYTAKTVALFGLGDQEEYGDFFVDAMGTLYDRVTERGATVVGSWPTDGYDFEASAAVQNGEFVGLAIDADNQEELTDGRLEAWLDTIRPYLLRNSA